MAQMAVLKRNPHEAKPAKPNPHPELLPGIKTSLEGASSHESLAEVATKLAALAKYDLSTKDVIALHSIGKELARRCKKTPGINPAVTAFTEYIEFHFRLPDHRGHLFSNLTKLSLPAIEG